ncbi:MliC family protein [Enterovibrio norvegicus]|uniref:Membrane-bound lysozyme-inhibitor of c-type lysozyme n=2 Tax=Enterovibrio norvegicus TaxID=188144 RepID=A0A1I5P4E7_9GAMM|nr:MliC family protein [Enterovibrio norvegicus]OEF60038.1 hypothetical protein A1OU_03430 [Enterovibrio norvegicus]SFP28867.1 Membrane-bound lysozyme-inhibitor of c-type lysozyme [Enterovibrio norvegicus DSM 15893]
MKKVMGICLVSTLVTACSSTLPHQFTCEDGFVFDAMVTSDTAVIRINDVQREIPRIRAASGAQYESEDKETGLYTKGKDAMLVWDELSYRDCVMR